MTTTKEAEELNQKYALELAKLVQMRVAVQQQEDIVTDLHYKYVKAVTKKR